MLETIPCAGILSATDCAAPGERRRPWSYQELRAAARLSPAHKSIGLLLGSKVAITPASGLVAMRESHREEPVARTLKSSIELLRERRSALSWVRYMRYGLGRCAFENKDTEHRRHKG